MSFDVEYDVVVIGSGGSGKSAAYTIATESDLSVAVLEKMDRTGGSSIFAEGTGASESIEQQERGIPDYPGELPEGAHFPTNQEHYQRYLDFSHNRANPEVCRAAAWGSAETIAIHRELGVKFTDVTLYAFNQDAELYTFHRPDGLGFRVQELLERACINNGVDIFTNTKAEKLITEDGAVVGVEVTDADGNAMSVGGKAVIIATGGFGNNPEMVAKYSWMPKLAEWNCPAIPTENTGDGINMAIEVGAATRDLGAIMLTTCALNKTLDADITATGCQPTLWVNSRGERFVNEILSMSFTHTGNAIARTDDGMMWSVFDHDTRIHFEVDGSDIGLGDAIPYHKPLAKLDAEIEASLEAADGAIVMGDTIEELAEKMGCCPKQLQATVDRYNELVDAGFDEDFFKPAEYLRAIKTAPFYAVHQKPSILVSVGGIRINGNFQVTDDQYKPIPGLYAVGNDASGLHGDMYNLDVPGAANGFAHTSGRLAARHAIKTITG